MLTISSQNKNKVQNNTHNYEVPGGNGKNGNSNNMSTQFDDSVKDEKNTHMNFSEIESKYLKNRAMHSKMYEQDDSEMNDGKI